MFVDARYEKILRDHKVESHGILIALAVNGQGKRDILGVEVCNTENDTNWPDSFHSLIQRGLGDVRLVISDAHRGLVSAIDPSRRIKIRYEDLISRPEEFTKQLSLFIGAGEEVPKFDNLTTGAIFKGNRIRRQKEIALKRFSGKRDGKSFWDYFILSLQFPFLLVNGYIFHKQQSL